MNGARGFPAHRFALRTLSNNRVSCSSLSSRAEPSGQCFSVEAYPLSCLRLTQRFCNDARLHFARSCGFRTTALRCRRSDCSWHTVHVGSPYRRPRDLDGFPTLATMCLSHPPRDDPHARCRGRQGYLPPVFRSSLPVEAEGFNLRTACVAYCRPSHAAFFGPRVRHEKRPDFTRFGGSSPVYRATRLWEVPLDPCVVP